MDSAYNEMEVAIADGVKHNLPWHDETMRDEASGVEDSVLV
jgi:hypothetical protein